MVGLERKYLGSIIYFPSSPPNQTHSKKFSFPFSLQSFPSTLFHLQTGLSFFLHPSLLIFPPFPIWLKLVCCQRNMKVTSTICYLLLQYKIKVFNFLLISPEFATSYTAQFFDCQMVDGSSGRSQKMSITVTT